MWRMNHSQVWLADLIRSVKNLQILRNDFTTPYHYYGIRIIQRLQCILMPVIPMFELISALSDPSIVYYFLFPITFYVGPHLGLSLLWSASTSEAINLFLKMFVNGERPYWWARENSGKFCRFNLIHFPSTCESTPGTASDHAFVATAVWTSLILMWCPCQPDRFLKRITKILSFSALVLICVSRMVIAAHFPHQVLLGVFLGLLTSNLLFNFGIYNNAPISYFRFAFRLLFVALIIKVVFPKLGMCHCWSLIKAKRFCTNAAWVRKCSETPFESFLRLASLITGTGLSMLIIISLKDSKVHLNSCISRRLIATSICLMVTSFIYFHMSDYRTEGPPGYSFIIMKNMMIPLTTIVFVPLLCDMYHR